MQKNVGIDFRQYPSFSHANHLCHQLMLIGAAVRVQIMTVFGIFSKWQIRVHSERTSEERKHIC